MTDETANLLQRAVAMHQGGDLAGAEAIYAEILAREPNHFDALQLLGMARFAQREYVEAERLMARALAVIAGVADVQCNHGLVLLALGRVDEAVSAFGRAIALEPPHREAHIQLALLHSAAGRFVESAAHWRAAVAADPGQADAWNNLANAIANGGSPAEAVPLYERSLALKEDAPLVHSNLAAALRDLALHEGSLAHFRRALALNADLAAVRSNYLLTLHYTDKPGADLHEEHREFGRRHMVQAPPHSIDRDLDRPLRIGYVSADFREHPVAALLLPILTHLHKEQFTTTCYSAGTRRDAVTDQLKSAAAQWREIARLSDDDAAQLIRDDRIDILVDLSGHTAGNRLLLFARKPAPVQVTHFAYPDTTGLSAIDYRITDELCDPPDSEAGSVEKLCRLPRVAWCWQPLGPAPDVSPPPSVAAGRVTFGSMNHPAKLSKATLARWGELLGAFPDSQILLLLPYGTEERIAAALGVDPKRLIIVRRMSRIEYLATYASIDIALDPYPYNGGVTTCDALWMGVPVLFAVGQTYASRQTQMITTALGEAGLANDAAALIPRLTDLRQNLRQRLAHSALMDYPAYVRDLGAAYRRMFLVA